MTTVYKITNKLNGMSYIGQTSRTVQKRMQDHMYDCYRKDENNNYLYDYPLYVAMREYGRDAFDVEILEENLTQDEADEREKHYIKLYHTAIGDDECNGYNVMLGGAHGCVRFNYNYDKMLDMYANGCTYTDISKVTNTTRRTLYDILHKYNVYDASIGKKHMDDLKRGVEQIDPNTGDVINVFASRKAAARALGKNSHSKISLAANGKIKSAYGYIWRNIS